MAIAKANTGNYLIMFFLLMFSGAPFFVSELYSTLYAVILIAAFLLSRGQNVDFEIGFILSAILICIFFQSLVFSYFKAITVFGQIQKILIGYLAIKLLREHVIDYFLDVLAFLSLVSLVIFIPILVVPSLLDTIISHTPSFLSYSTEYLGNRVDRKTLILYNLMKEADMVRNPGPFWEPGAFGGFLIIGLIFNTIKESKIFTRRNWLFFAAIITTQSTTAYLALFVFLILYLLFQSYSATSRILVLVIGIAGIIAFQNISFLGEKIDRENAGTQNAIEERGGDSRMASAVLDWNDIKRYPFTGRGIWPETRVDKKYEYVQRNNGLTNFIAIWGIFIFAIFFYFYYKGFFWYCKLYDTSGFMPVIILAMFWLVSFSENYFNYPFFWCFVFLSIPLKKYYYSGYPDTGWVQPYIPPHST